MSLGNLRLKSVVLWLAALCLAQSALAASPSIQIPRIIDAPPKLTDFEEMHPIAGVARHMLKVTGFIAREPADGAQPTQDTEVYQAYLRSP